MLCRGALWCTRSPFGPIWQLSYIVTLVYIDIYFIAMLYIIRYYYSVILVTYRMLNWNCILRDDTYVHRSVLATSLCWATPALFLCRIWLASAPFVLNWANPLCTCSSSIDRAALFLSACWPLEWTSNLEKVWNCCETKDSVDIIIGMVCNGCDAMTVDDHLRSWLLFLRLLHAISVAFVCFSEYYLCEFNQRGSLSTCTFRLMFTTINSQ